MRASLQRRGGKKKKKSTPAGQKSGGDEITVLWKWGCRVVLTMNGRDAPGGHPSLYSSSFGPSFTATTLMSSCFIFKCISSLNHKGTSVRRFIYDNGSRVSRHGLEWNWWSCKACVTYCILLYYSMWCNVIITHLSLVYCTGRDSSHTSLH